MIACLTAVLGGVDPHAVRVQHAPKLMERRWHVLARDVLDQVRAMDVRELTVGERQSAEVGPDIDRPGPRVHVEE